MKGEITHELSKQSSFPSKRIIMSDHCTTYVIYMQAVPNVQPPPTHLAKMRETQSVLWRRISSLDCTCPTCGELHCRTRPVHIQLATLRCCTQRSHRRNRRQNCREKTVDHHIFGMTRCCSFTCYNANCKVQTGAMEMMTLTLCSQPAVKVHSHYTFIDRSIVGSALN